MLVNLIVLFVFLFICRHLVLVTPCDLTAQHYLRHPLTLTAHIKRSDHAHYQCRHLKIFNIVSCLGLASQ